ncbi:MAG: hypothetical protein FWD68_17510 [Alphaproteobacteria bacterium]|nr:hypothetical protein [Alphaproteobacteria bacterium]
MTPEKHELVKCLMRGLTRKATEKEICGIGKLAHEIYPECPGCGRIYARGCLCHPVIERDIQAAKSDLERMKRLAENAVAREGQVRGFPASAEPPFLSKLSKFLDLGNDRLLHSAEVAAFFRTSGTRLRKDRARNSGPVHIEASGRVFYFASDVAEWLEGLDAEINRRRRHAPARGESILRG